MGRISEKDAIRLGIITSSGEVRSRRTAAVPERSKGAVQKSPVPKTRKPAALGIGKGKPNRRPMVDLEDPFEVGFFVPGEPMTKGRARTHMPKEAVHSAFVIANGDRAAFASAMSKVKHRSFTPTATVRYEALVARVAAAAMRSRPPVDVPVEMLVVFAFEGDPCSWPTDNSDPDIDNVQKAVMDALKGIVWTDDRLVVRIQQVKSCAALPGVTVRVRGARPFVLDGPFPA